MHELVAALGHREDQLGELLIAGLHGRTDLVGQEEQLLVVVLDLAHDGEDFLLLRCPVETVAAHLGLHTEIAGEVLGLDSIPGEEELVHVAFFNPSPFRELAGIAILPIKTEDLCPHLGLRLGLPVDHPIEALRPFLNEGLRCPHGRPAFGLNAEVRVLHACEALGPLLNEANLTKASHPAARPQI